MYYKQPFFFLETNITFNSFKCIGILLIAHQIIFFQNKQIHQIRYGRYLIFNVNLLGTNETHNFISWYKIIFNNALLT